MRVKSAVGVVWGLTVLSEVGEFSKAGVMGVGRVGGGDKSIVCVLSLIHI